MAAQPLSYGGLLVTSSAADRTRETPEDAAGSREFREENRARLNHLEHSGQQEEVFHATT
jgi:hypothetical protein